MESPGSLFFYFIVSGNVIIRDCASSLNTNEVAECAQDDQCIYCSGDNCNTELPSSDAAALKSTVSLIFTIFIATLLIS